MAHPNCSYEIQSQHCDSIQRHMRTQLDSFEELGNQSEYKFGAVFGGSTMHFFKYSRIETFRKLWETMQNQTPTAFVAENDSGVRRALQEK
ncbi:hypothetical protein NECAME_19238 [Necator americanus]|uniref:Uncharacterized protein n=1 Tax=Necator americanus TaxID=51031 RepID=W2SSI7_NECAM|nr:hypothetical protein NECAME_19238 [Necator americanus]ETN71667.1 hypothetical protein NECAME_19238 [Necator americanus]